MSGAGEGASPLIFLIAGEPSGDQVGGRLMAALKRQTDGAVRFAGIGGERMKEQGLESLFPMEDLSVFGIVEVVPHVPRILRRMRQTVAAIKARRPDTVVTIDSPEFSFGVGKRLKGAGIPLIHCVAPQIWAWRPRRARAISRFLDHILVLLPFEPPYFEAVDLGCTFIGHPVVESGADKGAGPEFRSRHGIPGDAPLLCILPGSRRSETSRLLPVFVEALRRLARDFPRLHGVLPTVSAVEKDVASAGWPIPITLVKGQVEKYNAFAASTAALAASGTVALELAVAGLPMVVAYKVTPLSAWVARRMMRVRYATFVNLILDRALVPELLQEKCTPPLVAEAVTRLFSDGQARKAQIDGAREVALELGLGRRPPSERGAEVILDFVKGLRQPQAPRER